RKPQRTRDRLEHALNNVVRVVAAQHVDVQVHGEVRTEAAPEMLDHFRGQTPHLFAFQLPHLAHQERAAAEVQRAADQRLIHGDQAAAVAVDAGLVAGRLLEGFADRDGDVFHAVVGVHVQVAAAVDGQIEQAVFAEQLQHVVQEADAGLYGIL